MLGRGPVSSTPISGSPFSLVRTAQQIAATLTLTFGVGGTAGAIVHPTATIGIAFDLSPTLIVHQALLANVTITFGGTPTLFVAGKPIKLSAVPQSFDLRAQMDRMTLKALPSSFTLRGSK